MLTRQRGILSFRLMLGVEMAGDRVCGFAQSFPMPFPPPPVCPVSTIIPGAGGDRKLARALDGRGRSAIESVLTSQLPLIGRGKDCAMPDDQTPKEITGRCYCGAITVRAIRPPRTSPTAIAPTAAVSPERRSRRSQHLMREL